MNSGGVAVPFMFNDQAEVKFAGRFIAWLMYGC